MCVGLGQGGTVIWENLQRNDKQASKEEDREEHKDKEKKKKKEKD